MCRKLMYLFLVLFVPAVGTVAQAGLPEWEAAIKGASPLHWYKFNEATGTSCIDSGSGALNGTYESVSLAQAGFFGAGAAVGFTRTGANRATFTGATDLTGPWTVEYVVKTTKPPAANNAQCLHDSSTASIRLAGYTALGEAGYTLYGVADYRFTPAAGLTLNNLVVQQDVWMHLVWRNNGSGVQLFFNGKLMGTNTNMINLPRLTIGGRAASTSDQLQGVLDEAVVFNRALTDADIIAHAAASSLLDPSVLIASNPTPADGATHADTWVSLSWSPGAFAVSHDVYLGNNFDDVNAGTGGTFRVNQTTTYFVAGFPGFAYPDGLVPGTTYYWRIDEVAPANTYKGKVWSFMVPPKTAYNPNPADGAKYVDLDVTLSWTAGFGAKLHQVYFGENQADVEAGTGGTAKGPAGVASYKPTGLALGGTYYWRIDEFDGAKTYKGDVWSFKTIPNIAITDPDLMGWWKLDEGYGVKAIDSSGHGSHGTINGKAVWAAGYDGGALQFDGSTNYIDVATGLAGSDAGSVAAWIKTTQSTRGMIFYGSDVTGGNGYGGENELHLNVENGGVVNFYIQGAGTNVNVLTSAVNNNAWRHVAATWDKTAGVSLYLDGAPAGSAAHTGNSFKFAGRIRLGRPNANERYYAGAMDDVRLYKKALTADQVKQTMRGDPLLAWDPRPANGSVPYVKTATPLSWSAGEKASAHNVYFGTNRDALDKADATDTTGIYRGRQSAATYTPPEGVQWAGGPYYWRIDEVNTDATISTGRTWTFTVADHIPVDNFESYDAGANQIWYSWHDGLGYGTPGTPNYFAGNGTGAAVGDENTASFTEETIVHGGRKSMPVNYDNNKQGFAKYSEAEYKLTAPRDWTEESVGELSIWFRGRAGSVGSFTEAPAGTYTMTASGADIWNNGPAGNRHDEFHFAYKTLTGAGSIVARVQSVQNTNGWAKAGVMIRETLDGGSKHAFACVTPSNGVGSQGRDTTGGDSFNTNQTGVAAPYWVKLERDAAGNFTASHSANGTTWQPVTGATPKNIPMATTVYVGLALTSHDASRTCQAVFTNVTTTGTVSPQWANQDIGIASNAAEPLYVAVSNAAGQPAVVVHPDPKAAQITTWTEWVIPLQSLTGITLTNVDKLALGLGTRGNTTTPGGSGKMYFDDIRLYRVRTTP